MEYSNGNPLNLSALKEELKETETKSNEKDICIFFSFDLVGSTKLKTIEKDNWASIIFKFYNLIYTELRNDISQIAVWKYVGDEILLYISLKDLSSETLYKIPKDIFDIQRKVSKKLNDSNDSIEKNASIDIKSTIWIAGVKTVQSQKNNEPFIITDKIYRNLKVNLSIAGSSTVIDFLGTDIDTGFRVAKYAYHNKVILSSDFAYLLYCMEKPSELSKIDDKLKIVSYEQLKGIWDDKYYPIIWYYPNWKSAKNDFSYAEHKENYIVSNILSKRYLSITILDKIYNEIKEVDYIKDFIKECKQMLSYNEREIV